MRTIVIGTVFALALLGRGATAQEATVAPPKKKTMNGPQDLTAGPIRLKYQDGELRYLYVGDREIVRRVYFAVRNKEWATAMPVLSDVSVKRGDSGGFTIDLKADCKSVGADYSWTGHIEGTRDGKITFHVSGAANAGFDSNRIGLCVLFGTPTVVGQKFETVNAAGETRDGTFPPFVSPKLVAPDFQTLRYTSPDQIGVSVGATGAKFDMEDQRTYGDSSFKAYAPLPYIYKAIPRGKVLEETMTISVTGGATAAVSKSDTPVRVQIGEPLAGITIPKIITATDTPGANFGSINGKAETHRGASALAWGFNPSTHLPDDDTFFENIPVLLEQVKTAHSFAPGAVITIDPVTFDSTRAPQTVDPRNATAFNGAWCTAVVKYLALAGVAEARFHIGDAGAKVLAELATVSGKPLRAVTVRDDNRHPTPIEGFAVDVDGKTQVWLINKSGQSQRIRVEGSGGREVSLAPYEVLHFVR